MKKYKDILLIIFILLLIGGIIYVVNHNFDLNLLNTNNSKEIKELKEANILLENKSDSLTVVITDIHKEYNQIEANTDSILKMKDWEIAQTLSVETNSTVILRDSFVTMPIIAGRTALIKIDSLKTERVKNELLEEEIKKREQRYILNQEIIDNLNGIIKRLYRNIAILVGGVIVEIIIIMLIII